MDGLGEGAQPCPGRDRQRELRDHVAGVGCDERGAQDPVGVLPDEDLEKALGAVEARTVYLAQLQAQGLESEPAVASLGLGQPDVRDLGRRVGAPGHDERARLGPAEEEGVLDHDAGQGVRGVGELVARRDVAGREDPRVGRAELIVHLDTGPAVGNPGGLEAQPVDVRRAPRCDQDGIGDHLARGAPAIHDEPLLSAGTAAHFLHFRGAAELDPVPLERPDDERRGFRVLAGEDAAAVLEQDHVRAEEGEGLRQLAADGPGADHREPGGPLGEREERLVRQVAGFREAGDGRYGRPGAGRDHGPGL